jgi:signal transduction histidine kinase
MRDLTATAPKAYVKRHTHTPRRLTRPAATGTFKRHWNRSARLEFLPEVVALLGLPFVAEGQATPGPAASADPELCQRAAALLGLERDDTALQAALAAARGGRPAALATPTGRAVALPLGDARALVVWVPEVDAVAREALHEAANALSAIAGWTRKAEEARDPRALAEALAHIDASTRRGREAVRAARLRPATGHTGPPHASDAAGAASSGSPVTRAVAREGAGGEEDDENGRVDVKALVREAAAALEPLAASRGVALHAFAVEGLWVRGNGGRLYSAVSNLLKNAVEAAPLAGHVRVIATRHHDEVRVTVLDDGAGLDEEGVKRALAGGYTTKEGGSGLGLGVARAAAAALGGSLTLSARQPHGLRAVLTLPLDASEPTAAHGRTPTRGSARAVRQSGVRARPTTVAGGRAPMLPEERPQSAATMACATLAGRRVLLVEDDPSLRDLLATALEAQGAVVWACADATEARAAKGRFDAAIADVHLRERAGVGAASDPAAPPARGDAVLAELRGGGVLRGPAILVSGGEPPADMVLAPDALLRKPFDLTELFETLASALGRRGRRTSFASARSLLPRRRQS